MNGILNLKTLGKRHMQTALSQRADFMVFCSVKGGGTESSRRYAFPGGVPEVIPTPSLCSFSKDHSSDKFFFYLKELL